MFVCKGAEETWAWCRGDEDRAGGKALAAVAGGCMGWWWWWRLLVRDERRRGEMGSAGEVDIWIISESSEALLGEAEASDMAGGGGSGLGCLVLRGESFVIMRFRARVGFREGLCGRLARDECVATGRPRMLE